MKYFLLFLIPFVVCSSAFSQMNLIWSNHVSAEITYGIGESNMILDSMGNAIVYGKVGDDEQDVKLAKYSPDGELLFELLFGDSSIRDECKEIATDSDGNLYLVGSTKTATETVAFTMKISPNGNILWKSQIGGAGWLEPELVSLDLDNDGNIYVVGSNSPVSPNSKILTAKYDSQGGLVWQRNFNLDSNYEYNGLKIRLVENILQVQGRRLSAQENGKRYVTLHYDLDANLLFENETELKHYPRNVLIDELGNSYMCSFYGNFGLVKYNSHGELDWEFEEPSLLPTNVTADEAITAIIDTQGFIYLTGRHYGDHYGDTTLHTNCDILTIKLNSDGQEVWRNRYEHLGGFSCEVGETIALDDDGNIWIGGQGARSYNGSDYDFVVLKLNPDGQQTLVYRYNDDWNREDRVYKLISSGHFLYLTGISFEAGTVLLTQKFGLQSNTNNPSLSNDCVIVYPNPASESIFIQLRKEMSKSGYNDKIELNLFNQVGQLALSKVCPFSHVLEMEAKGITPGIYNLQVKSSQLLFTRQVIIAVPD